jgi:hypothetical protein
MTRPLLIPLVLLVGALGACSPAAPQHPIGTGSVLIGTPAADGTGFLPLQGDQPLVPGAQGGFHVWLSYRVQGMSPGQVTVKRTVRRVSDNRLLLTTSGVQQVGEAGPDGYWELPAPIPSFMCPTPLGVKVEDQPAVFDLVILDASGTVLGEGNAEATPRCPTDGQAAFCQRICNG